MSKELKKIKAYIVYGGSRGMYNATLLFENGWPAFGHLCSSECFMPSDLWLRRKERQTILEKMGYEVELQDEIFAGSDTVPKWLNDAYDNEAGWKPMADEYKKISEDKS